MPCLSIVWVSRLFSCEFACMRGSGLTLGLLYIRYTLSASSGRHVGEDIRGARAGLLRGQTGDAALSLPLPFTSVCVRGRAI